MKLLSINSSARKNSISRQKPGPQGETARAKAIAHIQQLTVDSSVNAAQ